MGTGGIGKEAHALSFTYCIQWQSVNPNGAGAGNALPFMPTRHRRRSWCRIWLSNGARRPGPHLAARSLTIIPFDLKRAWLYRSGVGEWLSNLLNMAEAGGTSAQ